MADHLAHLRQRNAGLGEQALGQRQVVDPADGQGSAPRKVHNLPDVARITVLDRQDGAVARAALHAPVRRGEIGAGDFFAGLPEYPHGCHVRERALHPAVRHAQSADEQALVALGFGNRTDQKIPVVGAVRRGQALGVACDHLRLPRLVLHRQSVLFLVGCDHGSRLHPFRKQLRHFPVDPVYVFARLRDVRPRARRRRGGSLFLGSSVHALFCILSCFFVLYNKKESPRGFRFGISMRAFQYVGTYPGVPADSTIRGKRR